MDAPRIHEDFSKGYYWLELLEPTLQDINVQFVQFLLIVALIPYKSYVGFIRVSHTSQDPSMHGPWFSDYIQIQVAFTDEVKISIQPVHFRREISQWNKGIVMLDNRADM